MHLKIGSSPRLMPKMTTKIKELLKCQGCFSPMRDPKKLPCDHNFCGTCLNDFLNIRNSACPRCLRISIQNQIEFEFMDSLDEQRKTLETAEQTAGPSGQLTSRRPATAVTGATSSGATQVKWLQELTDRRWSKVHETDEHSGPISCLRVIRGQLWCCCYFRGIVIYSGDLVTQAVVSVR